MTQQTQSNSISDEKYAFLSLSFFHFNTDNSIYNKFINADYYYKYFRNNSLEAQAVLSHLDKENFPKYAKGYIFLNEKRKLLLRSVCGNLIEHFKPKDLVQPLLMNCFSLNLLNISINYIDRINASLIKNGNNYTHNLKLGEDIFPLSDFSNIPYLRYCVVYKDLKSSRRIMKKLNKIGYEIGNFNWSIPLNKLINVRGDFKKSELLSLNILNLPNHFYIDQIDILKICNIMNEEKK